MNSCVKVLLLCISFAVASRIMYNFCSKKKKESRKEINEAIFFAPDRGELKKSKYSRLVITESMNRLLYYLHSPRHTLDVCMYVFTNPDLANAIIKLRYRGVKIRMLVDADMAFSSGSSTRKLEKQGIPLRWMKSTNLMHHKFCLLDASTDDELVTPVLMVGSLNWTTQALSGNWESVTVTSQKDLVRGYKQEFERLWESFKPVVM